MKSFIGITDEIAKDSNYILTQLKNSSSYEKALEDIEAYKEWKTKEVQTVIKTLENNKLISRKDQTIKITQKGISFINEGGFPK